MTYQEGKPDPLEIQRDRLLVRIRNLKNHPLVEAKDVPLLQEMADEIQQTTTKERLTEIEFVLSEVEDEL